MADWPIEAEKGMRWVRYCEMTPAEREAEHRQEQIKDERTIADALARLPTLKERRSLKERASN